VAFVLNDLGRMHKSASKSAIVLLQNGFPKREGSWTAFKTDLTEIAMIDSLLAIISQQFSGSPRAHCIGPPTVMSHMF
jgi:hypothetical protein